MYFTNGNIKKFKLSIVKKSPGSFQLAVNKKVGAIHELPLLESHVAYLLSRIVTYLPESSSPPGYPQF